MQIDGPKVLMKNYPLLISAYDKMLSITCVFIVAKHRIDFRPRNGKVSYILFISTRMPGFISLERTFYTLCSL